jgi:hypothetical protein
MTSWRRTFLPFVLALALFAPTGANAATLFVGAASCDITPDMPSFLHGQHYARVSTGVQYPVTANVLVLETREGNHSVESAIIISVDLCVVRESFLMPLRDAIRQQLPEFDIGKTIIASTQTHTAPAVKDGYFLQQEGVMVPSAYVRFAVSRIASSIKHAWQSRRQAKFSYGLGHAIVGGRGRAD